MADLTGKVAVVTGASKGIGNGRQSVGGRGGGDRRQLRQQRGSGGASSKRSVSSDQFVGKSAIGTAAMAKDPATNVDRFAMQEHAAYSLVFVARAAIVAVSTLASALLGISAQQFLGPSYVAEARSMTNSVVGLVATLLAVVVGLLVSTSYGLFNSQQTDLETIVRSVARMRFVLRHFGPEAEAASAILRKQILQLKARLWPSDGGGQARKITHEGVHVDVHDMLAALDELRPANDEQRHALDQAREIFGKFIETQGSMIRSLASRVPNLLLNVVMGWACALFFGYGILAGANLLTLLMAALGSVAIASAIFLILEMSDPYTGLFRVSSAVLERLLERPTAPAESHAHAPHADRFGARQPEL